MASLVSQAEREADLAGELAQAATSATPRTITSEEQSAAALRDRFRDAYLKAADLHIATGLTDSEARIVAEAMRVAREAVKDLNQLIEARKSARGAGDPRKEG